MRLIPNFFFRNQEFFQHFVLSTQFTCVDDVVYPNLVLLYKSEEAAVVSPLEETEDGELLQVSEPDTIRTN